MYVWLKFLDCNRYMHYSIQCHMYSSSMLFSMYYSMVLWSGWPNIALSGTSAFLGIRFTGGSGITSLCEVGAALCENDVRI